ncbi:unnamed protein product [Ectocarpus sp. CCAP 1310/34]|nr:unnamed protein product [Ectocarpus sp. CCAP 1310/34]
MHALQESKGPSRARLLSEGTPEWIEQWSPEVFRKVGYGMAAGVVATGALGGPLTGLAAAVPVAGYWWLGLRDLKQESSTLKRNFPVLANIRFLLESIRPEIRQYFIESDSESVPFSRAHRSVVYARAKGCPDTLPFGTRRDLYKEGYEWICHSMYPAKPSDVELRATVGGPLVTQKYSAALLNVSAMSYGALSDNAILALSSAAKAGSFYHNTGEGGISRFHLEGGGSLVWNVGTGYFGCRGEDGKFDPEKFRENSTRPNVKMIEIKLSQGAKPGHGGILPGAKVTSLIAEARGVKIGQDCNSPPLHSAFGGPRRLVDFVDQMRELSGGKPVGVKMCVGQYDEVAALVGAMVEKGPGHGPDFFTVDGSEGGTGAAPPEFSNSVGTPLVEGLVLVDDLLRGAGLREDVKVICSGKVTSGFGIVRNLSLGADLCNSARGMMFALGCIQALKCGTNHCPTGIATQDPKLMSGLHVPSKTERVLRFQQKTVHTATEIISAAGVSNPAELSRSMIKLRRDGVNSASYGELFPPCQPGSLLEGTAAEPLQEVWRQGQAKLASTKE